MFLDIQNQPLNSNINNSNSIIFQSKMPILDHKNLSINQFNTPPSSKQLLSPKSLCRKPSFGNFGRKKNQENIKEVDRIRFISPSKTNFLITDQTQKLRQSLHMSILNQSKSTEINYPLIKRCVSPRHNQLNFQSRISSIINSSCRLDQSSNFTCVLSPSIRDFQQSGFNQFGNQNQLIKLREEVKQLKKENFDLNMILDEKNELLEKQKKDYDEKLENLDKYLAEIKKDLQNYQIKSRESYQKLQKSQNQNKQLQKKLEEVNSKLDKATKQNKMYKNKFRTNINKDQKQQASNRKYHQNCGKNHNETKNHCCKQNSQNQSHKINQILTSNQNSTNCTSSMQSISDQSTLSLKKIKSENSLSLISDKQICHLQNKEDEEQYVIYQMKIESLLNEIRYRDIQISTLRKAKCQYESTKKSYEKVKVFNRKLLAQVEYLTKQCDSFENDSNQIKGYKKNDNQNQSPTKLRKNSSTLDDMQSSFDFELSPQKKANQLQIDDCIY